MGSGKEFGRYCTPYSFFFFFFFLKKALSSLGFLPVVLLILLLLFDRVPCLPSYALRELIVLL